MLSKAWSLSKVGMEELFLICIAEGIRLYWGNPRDVAMLIVGVEPASLSWNWTEELEDEDEYEYCRL